MVAAMRIAGVPVLLGDFLITDNARGKHHEYLSTRPALSKAVPPPGQPRIAGLRKKVHKIGERLVVAYTGPLLGGQELLRDLYDNFEDEAPSTLQLEAFLSGVALRGKIGAELVGWIWEKRPLCFRWQSSDPGKLVLKELFFSGSGASHFQDEVMPASYTGQSSELCTAVDLITYKVVTKIGRLLMDELSNASNLQRAYGFGAEAILWDGAKFRYVENITFAFWNAIVTEANELEIGPSDVTIVYKNYASYSVMQVTQFEPKHAGGFKAIKTDVHVITPLYDDMPALDSKSIGRLSPESPILFTGVAISNPLKGATLKFALTSDPAAEEPSFAAFKDGVLTLNRKLLRETLPPDVFN
jgi:hypothetical protein